MAFEIVGDAPKHPGVFFTMPTDYSVVAVAAKKAANLSGLVVVIYGQTNSKFRLMLLADGAAALLLS